MLISGERCTQQLESAVTASMLSSSVVANTDHVEQHSNRDSSAYEDFSDFSISDTERETISERTVKYLNTPG